jgi:hypothetical protein
MKIFEIETNGETLFEEFCNLVECHILVNYLAICLCVCVSP